MRVVQLKTIGRQQYESCIETVKLLIKNGADVNAKNSSGETALTLAGKNGHKKMVDILKAAMEGK